MLFITPILAILVGLMGTMDVVVADQIMLKAPADGDVYYSGGRMNIEYQVRFDGMAALASAAVSLAYGETLEIAALFPNATWQRTSDGSRSGYDIWEIPPNMPNGTYILRVAGP
ncbi:hypothetical protein BX666DRAFT_747835 [Dichotomocladium elegans]|nr:hypothetical protein BX666DRAFT_747835 [Dichotomocladium elegans]